MNPNLWRWVGIGMLGALGVAWLTELWLTTRAPWRPWMDAPPAMVAPARRIAPPPPRSVPARPAAMGSTVIVERADGTAEQVSVGPGQTIIVGTDGSIHIVSGAGSAAGKSGAQAAEVQARDAAMKAKMAAAQQDMALAQQKAMGIGKAAVAIRKVAPPDAQFIYQQTPATADPNDSDGGIQPPDVASPGSPVPVAQP